ncbi:hypothetical protein KCU91_g135, partial [Aureobasidium melanogenum]
LWYVWLPVRAGSEKVILADSSSRDAILETRTRECEGRGWNRHLTNQVAGRLKAGAGRDLGSLTISLAMAGVMMRIGMALRMVSDCWIAARWSCDPVIGTSAACFAAMVGGAEDSKELLIDDQVRQSVFGVEDGTIDASQAQSAVGCSEGLAMARCALDNVGNECSGIGGRLEGNKELERLRPAGVADDDGVALHDGVRAEGKKWSAREKMVKVKKEESKSRCGRRAVTQVVLGGRCEGKVRCSRCLLSRVLNLQLRGSDPDFCLLTLYKTSTDCSIRHHDVVLQPTGCPSLGPLFTCFWTLVCRCRHSVFVATGCKNVFVKHATWNATTTIPRTFLVSAHQEGDRRSWCSRDEVKRLLHGPGLVSDSRGWTGSSNTLSLIFALPYGCGRPSSTALSLLAGMMLKGIIDACLSTISLFPYACFRRCSERRSLSEILKTTGLGRLGIARG